ncbi:hypothetical protein PR202_ga14101 [Eleusine coracana subsp. coracana]|uniref:DUF1232 domain-containing protein n=1 Tax=Eleusine coracana subsp. coracana TaxID=191504 RepID=A0AAV5CFQ0_ELECO|nr:hypothetical protein PR202_ga14101 [Eleusine coracana subsp. coracana]
MSSSSSASASAVPPEDDVCSICHDPFRIPCQANCSHWFCGKSLLLPPPARMMMMVALSAIYVLSPVDFLPESVLGIVGFLDDLFIILIVFMHLAAVYRSLLVYRHGGQY